MRHGCSLGVTEKHRRNRISKRASMCLLVFRFRYSEDDVVTYIAQILQGLDYLHSRRILHLDIKPENVIVTHMNIIKIIDFGSAQIYNPLFLKQFSPWNGTLEYMCERPSLTVFSPNQNFQDTIIQGAF